MNLRELRRRKGAGQTPFISCKVPIQRIGFRGAAATTTTTTMSAVGGDSDSNDNTASGPWTEVRKKNKNKNTPRNDGDEVSKDNQEDAEKKRPGWCTWFERMSNEEKLRYKEGRCIQCGTAGHQRAECPQSECRLCKKMGHRHTHCPDSAAAAKRSRVPGSGVTPAGKRQHLGSYSDTAKRVRTDEKFAYARVASKQGVVVNRTSDIPMTEDDERLLQRRFDEEYCTMLEKGEKFIPETDRWTLKPSGLHIDTADQLSEEWLVEKFESYGFKVLTRKQFEEQRHVRLTGFIRGATAEATRAQLSLMVARGTQTKGIKGAVKIIDIIPTEKGGILKISADEEAREDLANADDTFRIGASGLVKFTEVGRKVETKKKEIATDTARAKVEELKKSLAEAEKTLMASVTNEQTDNFLNNLNLGVVPGPGKVNVSMDVSQSNPGSGTGEGEDVRGVVQSSSTDPQ